MHACPQTCRRGARRRVGAGACTDSAWVTCRALDAMLTNVSLGSRRCQPSLHMKRSVMMRVSNSFIAASLLMALSIAQAHAAKSGCPSADKVKNPACGVKDEQSGMDVCKYRITSGADKTWIGED